MYMGLDAFLLFDVGKPKGAMITHGNIASNTSSVIKILEVSSERFQLPVCLLSLLSYPSTCDISPPKLHLSVAFILSSVLFLFLLFFFFNRDLVFPMRPLSLSSPV